MARIKPVSSAQAGLRVKIAYHFTRRSIGKLTGRPTTPRRRPRSSKRSFAAASSRSRHVEPGRYLLRGGASSR